MKRGYSINTSDYRLKPQEASRVCSRRSEGTEFVRVMRTEWIMLRYDRNLDIARRLVFTVANECQFMLLLSFRFDGFFGMCRAYAEHRIHRTERARESIIAGISVQEASQHVVAPSAPGFRERVGMKIGGRHERLSFTREGSAIALRDDANVYVHSL